MRVLATVCLGITLLFAGQAGAQIIRTSCTYRWQSSSPSRPSIDPMIKVCREVDFPSHAPMQLEFSAVNKTQAGVCISQVRDTKYPESNFALMFASSDRCPPQNDPRYIDAHRVSDGEFLSLVALWQSVKGNQQKITQGDFERAIFSSHEDKILAAKQFGVFNKLLQMRRLTISGVAKISHNDLAARLLGHDYSIRLSITDDESDFYIVYVDQKPWGLRIAGVSVGII
jgi:hypothetical protein